MSMKEDEIRPKDLLKRYVELSAQDALKCFSDCNRRELPCVACGKKNLTFQFNKHGFDYSLCNYCRSLYQTPRPTIDAFEQFYRDSESSLYWAEVFFPAVAEAQR